VQRQTIGRESISTVLAKRIPLPSNAFRLVYTRGNGLAFLKFDQWGVHAHAQLLVALRHSLLLRLKTTGESARGPSNRTHVTHAALPARQAGERGAFPAAGPKTAPRHLENEGATSETGVGSAHSSSSRVAGDHEGRQRPPCGFSAGKMCVSQPAARFLRGLVVFDCGGANTPK